MHSGQYKGNFYIKDEVVIANLLPTKAPVTRICFQIVPFSYHTNLVPVPKGSSLV